MHKIVNGKQVECNQSEIDDMEQRKVAHEAKVEKRKANLYQENRREAYPSIEDQLDVIYHKGLDAWKADIAAIKAKYPKPE